MTANSSIQPTDSLQLAGQASPALPILWEEVANWEGAVRFRQDFAGQSEAVMPSSGGVYSPLRQPEIRSNDLVSASMLFCFVIMLMIIRRDRKNLKRRVQDFFFPKNSRRVLTTADASEEKRLRSMLTGLLILLGALFFFFFAYKQWHPYLPGVPTIVLAPIYACTLLGFIMLKAGMYGQVHSVFFAREEQSQWEESITFLLMAMTFILFPLTLTAIYADVSLQIVTISALLTIVLAGFMLMFKLKSIFFKRKDGALHFILYLCGLEIAPLLVLWASLVSITKSFTTFYY